MPNTFLPSSYKFQGKYKFASMALHDIMKGGIPCMDTSPGGACAAHTRHPEQKHAHQRCRQRCTRLAREECHQSSVYLVVSERTLFSSTKNPMLHEQWMQIVFLGKQQKCVC